MIKFKVKLDYDLVQQIYFYLKKSANFLSQSKYGHHQACASAINDHLLPEIDKSISKDYSNIVYLLIVHYAYEICPRPEDMQTNTIGVFKTEELAYERSHEFEKAWRSEHTGEIWFEIKEMDLK